MSQYDDIIHLERPVSRKRSPMPMEERAAQFSPFAALTGYEEVIREAGRFTSAQIELDEDQRVELDRKLARLAERIQSAGEPVEVKLTWFEPDGLKLGGEYRTQRISIRRVDQIYRLLERSDRSAIPIDRILELELE